MGVHSQDCPTVSWAVFHGPLLGDFAHMLQWPCLVLAFSWRSAAHVVGWQSLSKRAVGAEPLVTGDWRGQSLRRGCAWSWVGNRVALLMHTHPAPRSGVGPGLP